MKLPREFKTKTIHSIHYSDWEEFVKKVYKVEKYHFVSMEETRNGTSHSFTASNKPLEKYDKEDIQRFIDWDGRQKFTAGLLLNDLAANNRIPPGDYIIKVYW